MIHIPNYVSSSSTEKTGTKWEVRLRKDHLVLGQNAFTPRGPKSWTVDITPSREEMLLSEHTTHAGEPNHAGAACTGNLHHACNSYVSPKITSEYNIQGNNKTHVQSTGSRWEGSHRARSPAGGRSDPGTTGGVSELCACRAPEPGTVHSPPTALTRCG